MKKVIFYLIIGFFSVHAMYSMNVNKKLENKSFLKIGSSQEVGAKSILQLGTVQQVRRVPVEILYCYEKYKKLRPNYSLPQEAKKLDKRSLKNLDKISLIRFQLYESIIDINEVNEDKETPLLVAIKNDDEKTVRLLLRHESIDVNKVDDTVPPLLLAAYLGYKKIVTLLLKNGANFNYSLNNQVTAYDIALENNYLDVVLLLDFYKYMVDEKLEYLLSFRLEDVKLEELKHKIPSNYLLEYLLFIAQNENEEKQAQKMYDESISLLS